MRSYVIAALLLSGSVLTGSAAISRPSPITHASEINASFVADRVFVELPLQQGGTLRFFTDTGGGGVLIYSETAVRLGLATVPAAAGLDAPPGAKELAAPLRIRGGRAPALPARILVLPDIMTGMGVPPDADGLLSQSWFAVHVWTWDYPAGRLRLESPDWHMPALWRPLAITFRQNPGRPALHFPRTVVEIAGEPTSMLLDTGATTVLTPAAAESIGGPRVRGTSMITAGRIAAWRKMHPDWRVIEGAQVRTGARMIEVPDVKIAGLQVGPVWFTERPDANFRTFMSSMTDAPVEGALGGNALRSLSLTVDYVNARGAVMRK